MSVCYYCLQDKAAEDVTAEHVIPRALGGNVEPTNPFVLRSVCGRCNTICGKYVDRPFIRGFLTQGKRATAYLKYADIGKGQPVPLIYMGELVGVQHQERICDYWLGPSGDSIYHFHQPYPEDPFMTPASGYPVHLKDGDFDPGFAFLFVVATNPAWHETIVRSFVEEFPKSALALGNGPPSPPFQPIPVSLKTLHSQLKGMQGTTHQCRFAASPNDADRFLAKSALGFGCLLMGEPYSQSPDAALLRQAMWEKDVHLRRLLPIKGTRFLSTSAEVINSLGFLGWPDGHTIMIQEVGGILALTLRLFSDMQATIQISADKELWEDHLDEGGNCYVVVPGLRRAVGPIPLPEFIAHNTEADFGSPALADLRQMMDSAPAPPPVHLD